MAAEGVRVVALGIIALRLIHIGSAILWAGGSIFIERFVEPTSMELGTASAPFYNAMMRRGLAVYFPVVALLTVLAGSILYWIDANGNVVGYLTGGGTGTAFGIGGIAAWAGFLVGGATIGPNATRIAKANTAMATGGETPELLAQVASASKAIHRAGRFGLVMLFIAIVTMATARYL
jgi:uncharacterized membrane protein